MNTRSGLCNSCGAYIGTENWSSCPNCGDENCGDKVDSGYDENDDDDDDDDENDEDDDDDEDEQF